MHPTTSLPEPCHERSVDSEHLVHDSMSQMGAFLDLQHIQAQVQAL